MMRTLYSRLALALFVLLSLAGGLFLVTSLYTSHMYQQEVAQRLNRDLARYIVEDHVLMEDGRVDQQSLEGLFHNIMIINPSLELYLLGVDGEILEYSAAPEKVRRTHVSLEHLHALLEGTRAMPVLGDDPRGPHRRKAFSVAPIDTDGRRQGYIYAILGGEQVDHITQLLQKSYILRWSTLAVGTALVFGLVSGLLVFFSLTRRLRTLSRAMERFKRSDFNQSPACSPPAGERGDEIDVMARTFCEMAERIQTQMEKLRETDALRRELVANVSHDLRTPLSCLKGYLETLLLKDRSLSAAERRNYLQIAHRHSDRLSRLVVELFELAKLDANELKPQLEPFSVGELVHDVIQKFQLRAGKQGVEISVGLEPDPPYVEADIGMIERVLTNLIDNAFKHTPAGGSIRVVVRSAQGHVSLNVSDTGHGIPRDELPHIFRRFYRKADSDDTPETGAGLGLAIAQRIVELHGSRLSVRSAPEQGTAFDFDLPAHVLAATG